MKLLSDKRVSWAEKQGESPTFRGSSLAYPAAAAAKYEAALTALIEPMIAEYEKEIRKILKAHGMDEEG